MLRRTWLALALLSLVSMAAAAPALAFDGGPHAELTEDSMSAEGFEKDAVGLAQVNSWFNDIYEQAGLNPYSGHGGFWKRVMAGAISAEQCPSDVVAAATRAHFDNSLSLSNTAAITAEWDRLQRAVWTIAREARDRDDPEELVAVIGMSLHQVQDFYAHTNWVEPHQGLGAYGPGWQERGYGSSPTWFDIPASVRETANIYSDESRGHREHGYWDSDRNASLTSAMNKDWPGRPYYLRAAITAYFASRQWLEAIRSWVGDDAFWARAQSFRADQAELKHDLRGMFEISLYSGHWQGQGEPAFTAHSGAGGDLLGLRSAAARYFNGKSGRGQLNGRTRYRLHYQGLIRRMADPHPGGQIGAVPSSQNLQRSLRFVVLRVLSMRGEGLGDPGPDDADLYADVAIDRQQMTSAVIGGHDKYNFPRPNAPFTWIKAVPAIVDEEEPIESIEVDVRTANDHSAGTNDDVFLRLAGGLRLPLDKRLYDDFEGGDHETYSVPIDDFVKRGIVVGDITRVGLEKSPDGLGGGWELGGITLRVNGYQIYENQHIERWLHDNDRKWTAPDFVPHDPHSATIPVWLRLTDEDSAPFGESDEGDINPFNKRRTVLTPYAPGETVRLTTKGGDRFGGRIGDGDRASVTYSLETITPETIRATAPTPPTGPPAPTPDLVISRFTYTGITVANRGGGPAGPFRMRISDGPFVETKSSKGLAPGTSIAFPIGLTCTDYWVAVVDDLNQVDESNENNNSEEPEPTFC